MRNQVASVRMFACRFGLLRRWAMLLMIAGCVAMLTGCQAGGVNVVREASLSRATQLEILEQSGNPPTGYVSRRTISDQTAVQRVVIMLDRRLSFGPRARCLGQYLLRFRTADGQVQEFEYFCLGGTSFLRGEQPFWQGKQVVPPAEFGALIQSLLAP